MFDISLKFSVETLELINARNALQSLAQAAGELNKNQDKAAGAAERLAAANEKSAKASSDNATASKQVSDAADKVAKSTKGLAEETDAATARLQRINDQLGFLRNDLELSETGFTKSQAGVLAWAKSVGKLIAHRYAAKKLVIDFSEIRPAGERLKGYGWISSGDASISKAYAAIIGILNKRAGNLLTRIDILDVVNWLGTVLSSRRSAEIALFEFGEDEWEAFAIAKKDWWVDNVQRSQSNNSLLFGRKPTYAELRGIFDIMGEAGGSEPGFINAVAARQRAPWFKGVNPCAEILLGNKSFCNLTETDVAKFKGNSYGLQRAIYIAARANYRQTCVSLLDGVLQEAWHLNNEFLRLCGVGITGIVKRPDLSAYDYDTLERIATSAAYGMADELGLPRPKNVTTIKPSGTLSKVMDTTEGLHKPLGKYIFNNVNYGRHDPVLPLLRSAGYRVWDNPSDPEGVLVTFPVRYDDVPFSRFVGKDGNIVEVNQETAIQQLDRYKMLMDHWCQQNASATISYSVDEVEDIIQWLLANWDSYVGASFLYRNDPTKTAKDLGYLYLPQEVVTKEAYDAYVANLQPIELDKANDIDAPLDADCENGVCPVR